MPQLLGWEQPDAGGFFSCRASSLCSAGTLTARSLSCRPPVVQPNRKDRIVEEVVALIPAAGGLSENRFLETERERSACRMEEHYLAPRSISATISRAATTGSLASRIGRPTTM